MTDSMLTRLLYRRKFPESVTRQFLDEIIAEFERLMAVVPEDGELSAEQVLGWFGRNGVSLVPFQRQIFVRDYGLTEGQVEELCPRPEK